MATRRLVALVRRPSPAMWRRFERWGQPVKTILNDYVDVTKDALSGMWKHPVKALLYALSGGAIVAAWKKRPDFAGYVNDVLEYSNEISQCSTVIRNPHAQAYIERCIHLKSEGYLLYMNFGIFSIILLRKHSPECKNYHETCKHLQPKFWTVYERVVDVGFWGKWHVLEQQMVDFDVNGEQLEKSLAQNV